MTSQDTLRNIAIIAHVDHGKTTLVDALLRQSNSIREKADAVITERLMDSNDLEREKGITIFSKNAAIHYRDHKINIVDTPGHADFGGEVERIMKMVDGCLLLVDAREGPMPQTRFVLKKALEHGHRIIVVVNKVDRKDARVQEVLNETFDLFLELGASDEQAEFPTIYASAVLGKAGTHPDLDAMTDISPLIDTIIESVPAPTGDREQPLQLLTLSLAYDEYRGKLAIGKITNGTLSKGQMVTQIDREGVQKKVRVADVYAYEGMGRAPVETAYAGDIVAIGGLPDVHIGETIADPNAPVALPIVHIEEPTVKMIFAVNTSPFAGLEGPYCTSRNLRDRLYRELETDVALRVNDTESADAFEVSGRGELHLAILIEKMRREGYEMQVSRPQVIYKMIDGKRHEPMEAVYIEVPDEYAGAVMENMSGRLGTLIDMRSESGLTTFEFSIPTRGLIGFRHEFVTDTRGRGIMNSMTTGYEPYQGDIRSASRGFLVAHEAGTSNPYGLNNAESRGVLFIGPQVKVYEGMIVGVNARPEDLDVNIAKMKHLTNHRSSTAEAGIRLTPPRNLSLEQSIEILGDDELLEVTPKSLRLRKAILDGKLRQRAKSRAAA
ncbi:MAG: translational GTPase TypA [Armatimonadetes bacterium]|nr:translational GTPase TypA [Armatimonadota bacterium]